MLHTMYEMPLVYVFAGLSFGVGRAFFVFGFLAMAFCHWRFVPRSKKPMHFHFEYELSQKYQLSGVVFPQCLNCLSFRVGRLIPNCIMLSTINTVLMLPIPLPQTHTSTPSLSAQITNQMEL